MMVIDPIDGKRKSGPVPLKKLEEYQTFEEFYDGYKALLDYYLDLSVKAQYHSYEVMNQHVSFLFTSLLTDDCIARGKSAFGRRRTLSRRDKRDVWQVSTLPIPCG